MAVLEEAGTPFACVTLIQARGSIPQELGAKLLVTHAGRACGTVGGGRLEQRAIDHALALLQQGPRCEMVEWNLSRDIGMTCGGVVSLLFETFARPAWSISIFGAGHVAQALTRVLGTLDCRITVFDSRTDWLEALPRTPNLLAKQCEQLETVVASIPEDAFVVLMTQGHRTDRPVLARILQTRQFPYLGVIGSAAKAAALRKELRTEGISEERCRAFRCPVGLQLGNNTPEEIAISIAAEMLQVRDQIRNA